MHANSPSAGERTPSSAAGSSLRSLLARANAGLFRLVELSAGTLVLIDIILLLVGVVARYVFHRPLTWSDEVAVIAFLWIAMLGSVIAARDDTHMRLSVVTNRLPEQARRIFVAFSALISIVLMAVLILPSIHHVKEHWTTLTPALQISDGLRLCALIVGVVLMLLAMIPRMLAQSDIKSIAIAAAVLVGIVSGLSAATPLLHAMGNWSLAVFFLAGVSACILAGVPIAFAFGISTVAYLQYMTNVPMTIMIGRMDGGISELLLLSIPLFIALGMLLELTGMASTLIAFLVALIGHIRGGLSYVLLGAMFLVSGISGSKAADMAAVAPVLIPEMKKRGYKDGELIALLASSGAMSETIPPSLVLIALGAVAGISISALFTAGLLPAAVGALTMAFVAWYRSRRGDGTSRMDRATRAQIVRTLLAALPVLALPVLIRVAVIEGIATATEVATIGIAYTLVVGLIFGKDVEWRRMFKLLIDTASLTGIIMLIVGMATAMAWALTQSGFSQDLVDALSYMPGGKFGFMLISIAIFIILGSLLEGLPALVVLGPLMFPAAEVMGIHEVHYAMVVILAMGIGLFAPPFGVGYYMACIMSKIDPDEGMTAVWPYLASLLAITFVVAAVPSISLGFLK